LLPTVCSTVALMRGSLANNLTSMSHVVLHFFTETRWERILHLVK
jgi:hypothetical protein